MILSDILLGQGPKKKKSQTVRNRTIAAWRDGLDEFYGGNVPRIHATQTQTHILSNLCRRNKKLNPEKIKEIAINWKEFTVFVGKELGLGQKVPKDPSIGFLVKNMSFIENFVIYEKKAEEEIKTGEYNPFNDDNKENQTQQVEKYDPFSKK